MDSKAYTLDDRNKASAAPPDTPLAFAMMCLFTPENRIVNPDAGDTIKNLRDTFRKGKFQYDGINNPVPFAVRGAFSSVKTTKGELKGVQGTIFGFAVPAWMESVSGPGIRCCFLSGCHTTGGEVLTTAAPAARLWSGQCKRRGAYGSVKDVQLTSFSLLCTAAITCALAFPVMICLRA